VCLTKTIPAHKLDEADQSPLALAIHFENAAIIPDLLEVGFSPFGGYVTDEAYYPSMAYNILSGSNRNLSLESTLRTWLSAKLRLRGREKVLRLYTDTVRLALDVMWGPLREVGKLYTHPYSGDRLIISILLGRAANAYLRSTEGETTPPRKTNKIDALFRGIAAKGYLRSTESKMIPRGQTDKVDRIPWAMYAAIRCGHLDMVSEILEKLLESELQYTHRRFKLDQRHFLAQRWPYPCECPDDVHGLGARSLFDYSRSLESAPLCSHCKEKLSSYQRISELLQEMDDHLRAREWEWRATTCKSVKLSNHTS
jgi:hypothetical protein